MRVEIAGGDTSASLNLTKRVDFIGRVCGGLSGKTVLDCGCGGGDYVHALETRGADTWGVEYNMAKLAGSSFPGARSGKVQVGDAESIPFGDECFDIVTLNEVLEHVPDDRACLDEVGRVLRPHGTLILFSPNRLYPFETHGVYLRLTGGEVPHYTPFIPYIPFPVGRRVFRYWARNYWPWELVSMVEQAGFTVTHRDWVWQTFENISGRQPGVIRGMKVPLRLISSALERVPVVRTFGVSQVIVATANRKLATVRP